ncbi:MAG: sugar phosphate isomerase/epimerase [Bacteroidales bacterium]|nr:sugar phosphate isomerase/epimerase [Bacteroidales bacterium]
MLNRRNFLRSAALLAAAGITTQHETFAAITKKKMPIGLQLYSVRDDLNSDFDATMTAVVGIGYKNLEAAGYSDGKFYGKTPSEFKKYLSGLGAKLTGSHTGSGLLDPAKTQEWDFWSKNMDATAEAGCKWIVQAYYPENQIQTVDDVKRLAEQFNRLGKMAKQNGLRFAYHNHVTEFHKIEDVVPYDLLLNETDPKLVTFQMDTAQIYYGGGDCVDYLKKYPGRFTNWHVKDANPDGLGSTELGKGAIDFYTLFQEAKNAGLEDFYVEQERYNMSPIEAIRYDYDYLSKLLG